MRTVDTKERGVVQGKAVNIEGKYDKEIAAHRETKRNEMIEREKSIEKAARKEKSWELMRELKKIRENRGQWKENEELGGEERTKIEEEKEREKESKES